jgi:DtxR family Mn-dependent transcriptional regulator
LTDTRITVSKEDYLKAIAEAQVEGKAVIAATLVRWLGVSAPAVAMAIRRLRRNRLVRVDGDGHITLSAAGHQIADRLRRRHNLIERMLTEIFGMEWYKVHDEAERLEHAVSQEFESRLAKVLGAGRPCPHGELPGQESPKARRRLGWKRLDQVSAGERVDVASVFERDRKLLEHFDRLGLRPGVTVSLESRNCDETLTLRIAHRTIQIGNAAAAGVWVRPSHPKRSGTRRDRSRRLTQMNADKAFVPHVL